SMSIETPDGTPLQDTAEIADRFTEKLRKIKDIGDVGGMAMSGGMMGSGGTVTGVGEHVKAWTNHIRMVAVEPYESQAIGGGFIGRHGIPGLGAGFVPQNYNPYIVDRVVAVATGEALRAARDVLRTDAIPAAPSAGATLFAARTLLEQGKAKSALCVFSGRQLYE
ncbi:pyridoxal-phosphate dependent enzyme, partial [Candidatus Allofournierella excrementavium]|uniref:pyridoxal-phosphate dependent enzyme n=1 Tax=Candidatus Allofournierella excrementavium TaxID=2838591 RepID=UPI003AF8692E